ncbi:GNAT family N-acetyltransferase [Paenibacillus sp. URB8-2]|uniref:GNAT family N-acetyltransferase n=1 Tax=Paenibacillus sp. URB8-2 TaxID=2741301 RepID=UPI0015B8EF0C|nr:GNAT family N-acetyltransferase [Paenibacillus sp. URB8-2]BCG57912.1 GCN5 family acetyltransferase [Paenibacillus sp. URB8-2]
MAFELRELAVPEDKKIYEMAREIGPGENGFVNSLYTAGYSKFLNLLPVLRDYSSGIDLPPGHVPQTLYFLYADGRPVGYGKLRHRLTDSLLVTGGHIGYCIRPTARGKGYGTALLSGLLGKASELGIDRVLLTCDEGNEGSRRVIENNGGRLAELDNRYCRYWIGLSNVQAAAGRD